MLTKKQSWILPCIEAKVLPVMNAYKEVPFGVTIVMEYNEFYSIIRSKNFLFWYFCPDEMEQWIGADRSWSKYTWLKNYRLVRIAKRKLIEVHGSLN